MYVVKVNEITDSMYMIHTGIVEEIAEDLEEQTKLLHDDDNFGIVRFILLFGNINFKLTNDDKSYQKSFYMHFAAILYTVRKLKVKHRSSISN